MVLPLPDLPMTATNSLCRTSRLTSCNATIGPALLLYDLVTPVMQISGGDDIVRTVIEGAGYRDNYGARGARRG